MIAYVLGHPFSMSADPLDESIDRVPPVNEFPYIDADRAQAETVTGVRVKQNGPVIKLLSEHDPRIAYGFITVFDHSTHPFRATSAHKEQHA